MPSSGRRLLVGGVLVALFLSVGPARADLRDRFATARSGHLASDAKVQMERILASDDDSDVSAEAGIWLGQYEYALGRLESAHGYFEHAARIAQNAALRARAEFWKTHAANLLAADRRPGGEAGGAAPAASAADAGRNDARNGAGTGPVGALGPASAYDLLAEIARADAEVRKGDLQAAVRHYLEAEGRARSSGWLGPLAYRTALTMSAAKQGGKKDSVFDAATLEGWDDDLADSPERGLVFAAIRAGESLEDAPAGAASEYASPASAPHDEPVGENDVTSQKWGDGAEGILPVEPAAPERPAATGRTGGGGDLFVIQLGAFHDREHARREMEKLTSRGLSVRLEPGSDDSGDRVFRIRLGVASSRGEAESLAGRALQGLSYQLVPVEP